MRRKEIIRHNDLLYIVKELYPEHAIKADKVQELKELLECDILLRKNGILLYCEQIAEAEVITED